MQKGLKRIAGRVARLDHEPRPGFHLWLPDGRPVYCITVRPNRVGTPRPGQSVVVTGEWSQAIIGFFEAHALEITGESVGPARAPGG